MLESCRELTSTIASGMAITILTRTSRVKPVDNKYTILKTDAPNTLRTPISFALVVFQMKVSGAKEVDITERLRMLREAFAAAPAAK